MTRLFWSVLLVAMMVGGGWAIYAGAQGLVNEVEQLGTMTDPRYQFIEHFYVQSDGTQYEVFLRLDRETGQTWRFHAGRPVWTPILEPTDDKLPTEPGVHRYDLMAHEYRDTYGRRQELFLRVDFLDGGSWTYRGMADNWNDITVEPHNVTGAEEDSAPSDDATAQVDITTP